MVPGGGVALIRALTTISGLKGANEDQNNGITIAPPAALLALFETGPGKDLSCRPGSPDQAEKAAAAEALD